MQGLLVANKIVSIIIILIMFFAVVITVQINDMAKKDKEAKLKICKKYSTLFLVLLIVSAILFACAITGYSLLIALYGLKPADASFSFMGIFSSVISMIVFFTLYIMPVIKKIKESDSTTKTHNIQTRIKQVNFAIDDGNKENRYQANHVTSNSAVLTKGSKKCDLTDINIKNHVASNSASDIKEEQTSGNNLVSSSLFSSMGNDIPTVKEEDEVNRSIDEEISRYLYDEEQAQQALIDQRERDEHIRKEEEERRIINEQIKNEHMLSNFKQVSYSLSKKYGNSAKNYIDKLDRLGACPFVKFFKDSETPVSSVLIYPYRNCLSQPFLKEIKRDGLEFVESTNLGWNHEVQDLTVFYIDGLKKRLKENNEWQDETYLPLLLYTIVRNNVIKYYHDEYVDKYGHENLTDFCQRICLASEAKMLINAVAQAEDFTENTLKLVTIYYTYYYIYEKDMSLPFAQTYHEINDAIKKSMLAHNEKKLEEDLFGEPKTRLTIPVINVSRESTLQPIDYIDGMTGVQFELYLTQYFTRQGFKTTHTPVSGDYGIDLVIENDFGKIGVQAKCYSQKVPQDAIREVVAGLKHYGLSSGMVVTNNYFQPSAIQLARENNITLWDRDKLIEKLGE